MNDERYVSIEQSVIDSFTEIKEMEAGRLPERTWDELKAKLEKEFAEELEEERRQELYGNNLVVAF
ncbi:MAG: hypothetical protein IJK81_02195 [Selenomonadaceae bacterium]|nr:hypothetical protein [Selenomonadaceae bacterium]